MVLIPTPKKLNQFIGAQIPSLTQEVVAEVKLIETGDKIINVGGKVYNFTRPAEVKKVFSTYCCFSGSIKLSFEGVEVHSANKTLHGCSQCSNDKEDVEWIIPPQTIADKIETPEAFNLGTITFIDILGRKTETVTITDQIKELGRIQDLASTTGVQQIQISSSNPEMMVWVGRNNDFQSLKSSQFTDMTYACADFDKNGQCDFLSLQCSDGVDNDGDNKIDFPEDKGCENATDNDEAGPPACSDSIDNDGDGKIDFPNDAGCQSPSDGDEVNPPIDRSVILDNSSSGVFDENSIPMSYLKDKVNDYAIKVTGPNGDEMVPLELDQIFPRDPQKALINAQTYFHLLKAQESTGNKYIILKEARHWDLSTTSNANLTPEPYFSVFQNRGNKTQCLEAVKNIPSLYQFVESPASFQILLDLISLCQR